MQPPTGPAHHQPPRPQGPAPPPACATTCTPCRLLRRLVSRLRACVQGCLAEVWIHGRWAPRTLYRFGVATRAAACCARLPTLAPGVSVQRLMPHQASHRAVLHHHEGQPQLRRHAKRGSCIVCYTRESLLYVLLCLTYKRVCRWQQLKLRDCMSPNPATRQCMASIKTHMPTCIADSTGARRKYRTSWASRGACVFLQKRCW